MYKTYYNNRKAHEGQIFIMPSLTIPDQAMSINQMLSRAMNGVPLPELGLEYDDDPIQVRDLSDIDELKQQKNTLEESIKNKKIQQTVEDLTPETELTQ